MSVPKFENITYQKWQKAAEAALRGQSIDSLTKFTADGTAVKALYQNSRPNNQAPLPLTTWQINQAINHPDIAAAATQIAQDLAQGVNALSLYSNQTLSAHGYGLDLSAQNIDSLFQNTFLEMISLRLETGLDELNVAKLITTHSQNHAQLSLGIDPIGKIAQYGGWQADEDAKNTVVDALNQFDANHILRADGRIIHNAGGSEAQELSFIINSAYQYFKWADEANIALNLVASRIELCVCSDQNQFRSMAKIRALRNLWAELLDGLGIKQAPAYIYAETSYRMVSKRDPWVNLLRATIACFAAGVGGANQVGILPMSAAIGLAPAFDRRLARHIQTILIEESHLSDVTDPSAGSGYIETLTNDFVKAAWESFQDTENTGGLIGNLTTGNVQQKVKQVAQSHKPTIIGTSVFVNEAEQPYKTLDLPKFRLSPTQFKFSTQPLIAKRDAEIYENNVPHAIEGAQ